MKLSPSGSPKNYGAGGGAGFLGLLVWVLVTYLPAFKHMDPSLKTLLPALAGGLGGVLGALFTKHHISTAELEAAFKDLEARIAILMPGLGKLQQGQGSVTVPAGGAPLISHPINMSGPAPGTSTYVPGTLHIVDVPPSPPLAPLPENAPPLSVGQWTSEQVPPELQQ